MYLFEKIVYFKQFAPQEKKPTCILLKANAPPPNPPTTKPIAVPLLFGNHFIPAQSFVFYRNLVLFPGQI